MGYVSFMSVILAFTTSSQISRAWKQKQKQEIILLPNALRIINYDRYGTGSQSKLAKALVESLEDFPVHHDSNNINIEVEHIKYIDIIEKEGNVIAVELTANEGSHLIAYYDGNEEIVQHLLNKVTENCHIYRYEKRIPILFP